MSSGREGLPGQNMEVPDSFSTATIYMDGKALIDPNTYFLLRKAPIVQPGVVSEDSRFPLAHSSVLGGWAHRPDLALRTTLKGEELTLWTPFPGIISEDARGALKKCMRLGYRVVFD